MIDLIGSPNYTANKGGRTPTANTFSSATNWNKVREKETDSSATDKATDTGSREGHGQGHITDKIVGHNDHQS